MNDDKEPIVLGTLKKEKSSRPIFVVICFLLLLGTCFGLPYIKDYLSTEDNFIARLYRTYFEKDNGGTTIDNTPSDNADKVKDLHILNNSTSINYELLTLSNFELNGTDIKYKIVTKGEANNLDEKMLYLEIYGSTTTPLTRVKLTGSATNEIKEITTKLYKLNINKSDNYYGKVVLLSLKDYPDVAIKENTLTCTLLNNKYTYYFNNKELIKLEHTFNYTDTSDLTTYMAKLNESNLKTNFIKAIENCASSTTENDAGFTFIATLDLNKIKRSDLKDYTDYNYYDLKTTAKQVNYEMLTKGYDCK